MSKIITNQEAIDKVLNRGAVEVMVKESLRAKLASGRQLRVKLGIDPTGSLLHLGHAVVLRKLKDFQDLGHQIIFLIGDFTAKIGDPSGRSIERQPLTDGQIKKNLKDYVKQAGLILDIKKVEIRYNSEWLSKIKLDKLLEIAGQVTYTQLAHRADFKERIQKQLDLSLQEFLYPVMQGYDSVMLKAEVEVGGTDQEFNLLMGRQLQKRYGQLEQDIITCPLLEGLAGVEKMSKSLNNYIGLAEAPAEMYGKIMSIPDNLLVSYFQLCTDLSSDDIDKIIKAIKQGANPRDYKMKLAKEIVRLYHGAKSAQSAEEQFVKTFQKKEAPSNLPEIKISKQTTLFEAVVKYFGEQKSKGEIRRLFEQGGVSLNNQKITDFKAPAQPGVCQVGKRQWFRIV